MEQTYASLYTINISIYDESALQTFDRIEALPIIVIIPGFGSLLFAHWHTTDKQNIESFRPSNWTRTVEGLSVTRMYPEFPNSCLR